MKSLFGYFIWLFTVRTFKLSHDSHISLLNLDSPKITKTITTKWVSTWKFKLVGLDFIFTHYTTRYVFFGHNTQFFYISSSIGFAFETLNIIIIRISTVIAKRMSTLHLCVFWYSIVTLSAKYLSHSKILLFNSFMCFWDNTGI